VIILPGMPIYEYGCPECGHQFEITQKISEAPLKKCPECGKETLEKLISATAFHLKGGGWYKDLYSSKKDSGRSDNKVGDRLEKAKSDDAKKSTTTEKKKTDAA
jgi:putative FmdB family regulatory protein